MLRPYQQRTVDAIINWITKTTAPCCISAATGAGKSHIIAEVAAWIHNRSGKKVLCLAPSQELVTQNHSKYLLTGNPASIFCGSIGKKDMRHPVVFGSPLTVKNALNKFNDFAAVIIDEAHGITPTVKTIINDLWQSNSNMRVIGCSATPYRMQTGYIYANHFETGAVTETINPFFEMCVAEVGAWELIDQGYLTPPKIGAHCTGYDTSGLKLNRTGQWDNATVDRAFIGKGRLTSDIVSEVVEISTERKGVMFFAATVAHAYEIFDSLPPHMSAIVTADTKARDKIIEDFKTRKIKYLVNCSCLTTGFDAAHVDVLAILRATESPGLLQQIIGRSLRVDEDKKDALILDYAGNIERHFPDGDIFSPEISIKEKIDSEEISVTCPLCGFNQQFTARSNPDGFGLSPDGYFTDLAGGKMDTPSHYGRRCKGGDIVKGEYKRCEYHWIGKDCPHCNTDNDIAARFCRSCKQELIDPNEKLQMEAAQLADSPYAPKTNQVVSVGLSQYTSKRSGKITLKIDYMLADQSGTMVSEWLQEQWMHKRLRQLGIRAATIEDAVKNQHTEYGDIELLWRREKGNRYPKVVAVSHPNTPSK